jgi:hypothetical protein
MHLDLDLHGKRYRIFVEQPSVASPWVTLMVCWLRSPSDAVVIHKGPARSGQTEDEILAEGKALAQRHAGENELRD